MQTLHRLTMFRPDPDLSVWLTGDRNWSSSSIAVSQKLNLFAKKWQLPLAPLHSMNGVVRKSSKQLPGLDSDWPPPSAPAAVCCTQKRWHLFVSERNKEDAQIEAYHSKAVACPQCAPISRTSRNVVSLTVNRNHIGGNVTHDTPATTTNININHPFTWTSYMYVQPLEFEGKLTDWCNRWFLD